MKQDSSLNALTAEDINTLWLPLIVYSNTDQKVKKSKQKSWSKLYPVDNSAGYGLGMEHKLDCHKGGKLHAKHST